MRHSRSWRRVLALTNVLCFLTLAGNDLDNARLTFSKFRVPREAMLARYLAVDAQGVVTQPNGKKATMDMIGQRLFTGRVAIAQAAVGFAESLFASTYKFASTKVW